MSRTLTSTELKRLHRDHRRQIATKKSSRWCSTTCRTRSTSEKSVCRSTAA